MDVMGLLLLVALVILGVPIWMSILAGSLVILVGEFGLDPQITFAALIGQVDDKGVQRVQWFNCIRLLLLTDRFLGGRLVLL